MIMSCRRQRWRG